MTPTTKLISKSISRLQLLGGQSGIPGSYSSPFAMEIIYHRMQVSVTQDLQFIYDYLPGSGVFRPNTTPIADAALDDYIRSLQQMSVPNLPPLYSMYNAAPNIVAAKACYIAIELIGSQNLAFQINSPGINIDVNVVANYNSLLHYDTSLSRFTAGQGYPDDTCYLVCFGLQHYRAGVNDNYSINFQITQASGNIIDAQVDPHIKNRG